MHLPAAPPVAMRPGRRPVQARVLRHDALMLDSATAILAEAGWAGLSFAKVADRMGTSGQPVRSRARSRVDLAIKIWNERAKGALEGTLAACLDGVAEVLAGGDIDPLVRAWGAFGSRQPALDAAAELVVLSHFEEQIAEAVLPGLRRLILPWVTPTADLDRSAAARSCFAISLGLGILMLARHDRAGTAGMDDALGSRAMALQAPAAPQPMPDSTALHLIDLPELAPGDPALDILLNITLALVAEHGYDGVRVAQIARAAGFTEGLVYSRYRSKLDLFQHAVQRQNEIGFQVNHEFTETLRAEHGLGMAEAVLLREFLLPSHRLPRVMALEQVRLTWHDEELMRQANATLDAYRAGLLADPAWAFEGEADFFLNYAISLGVALMPTLAPEVYDLPFDVVTIPLFERLQGK